MRNSWIISLLAIASPLTVATLPAVANSATIGPIEVSPDLRSALQTAPSTSANANELKYPDGLEDSLSPQPVRLRQDPKVYKQFEEPQNNRGVGFSVGI
ncbi:hypothetical protein [Parathermosynechococcus lividus]